MLFWVSFILFFYYTHTCICDDKEVLRTLQTDVDDLKVQMNSFRMLYGVDIQQLRRELRTEKARRLTLEEKLERIMQHKDSFETPSTQILNSSANVTMLQKAFKAEKRRITQIDSSLDQIKTDIDYLKNSMVTKQTWKNVTDGIDARQEICENDLELWSEKLGKIACSMDVNIDQRTKDSTSFSPTFVSEWIMMKSIDEQKSFASIKHGLGSIPWKVDVQVRPVSGPNEGWIFPGSGATQIDDDTLSPYGGVVYMYNETSVVVIAPQRGNHGAPGTTIDTGKDSNWVGQNHQRSSVAYVRARVWDERDLPLPNFISTWTNISVDDSSKSFIEIPHQLGVYPDLVTVQIKLGTSGYISDGIGSSLFCVRFDPGCSHWNNWGGVIYGFNDASVRIWVPFITKSPNSNRFGHFGINGDGWGFAGNAPQTGQVRVLAWTLTSSEFYEMETVRVNKSDPELYFSKSLNINKDYISVYAEAADGANMGYRFKSWGGAQNPVSRATFGGLISAYSATGVVRFWRPDVNHKGTLINIKAPYGNSRNNQASDEGQVVATVFKPKCVKTLN